jgi:hypothetical protein
VSIGGDQSGRLVEQYDSLVELDVAIVVRELSGWLVLSAGEVRPGRWWAEFARRDGDGL